MSGELAIDQIDVRDSADAPLAGFKHMSIVLTELKPLESVTHLGKIYLDGLTVHVVRNPDGTINLASLAGQANLPPAPAAAQATPSPGRGSQPQAIGDAEPESREAIGAAEPRGRSDRPRRAKSTRRDDRRPGGGRRGCTAAGARKAGGCADGQLWRRAPRGKDGRRGESPAVTPTPAANTAQLTANAPPGGSEHAATGGVHSQACRSQRRIA